MIRLIQHASDEDIFAELQITEKPNVREIISIARDHGLGSKTWREERIAIANLHLSAYKRDLRVLNRLISIDATNMSDVTVIAASMMYRFVHVEFCRRGETPDYLKVLNIIAHRGNTSEEPLIIYWDNEGKSDEIQCFITEQKWQLWSQPRRSPDTSALYYDFETLRNQMRNGSDVMTSIVSAMQRINLMGLLQGVTRLPDIWRSLVRSQGLRTTDE